MGFDMYIGKLLTIRIYFGAYAVCSCYDYWLSDKILTDSSSKFTVGGTNDL